MAGKIAAVIFVLILTLFLLSVFAPAHSQRKFWRVIHKFRAGLDFTVYWFFDLCAIGSILYVCFILVRDVTR